MKSISNFWNKLFGKDQYDEYNIDCSDLTPSSIEKNGKILKNIPFVMHDFKKQIEIDLLDFFNISIKLDTYENMKKTFSKDSMKNTFYTEPGNNELIFNENGKDTIYTFDRVIGHGSFNKVDRYVMNGKNYILRQNINVSTNIDNIIFNTFYENLKHIILFIIMCRYNRQIKMIPRPSGMGWYSVSKSVPTESICFLSEAGKYDFFNYLKDNYNEQLEIEKICFQIYRDLYTINTVPSMNLCFKHCDLKPENIVLTQSNYPLIIDFGFSIFKIDDIDFIRPNIGNITDTFKFFSIYSTDNFLNAMSDFVILLYLIIYRLKIQIFDYKCKDIIICDDIIYSIFDAIHNIPLYSKYKDKEGFIHYIMIYNILYTDSIIQKNKYKLTPYKFLNFLAINGKDRKEYNERIYYKKYMKYKIKYLKLQSNLMKYKIK